MTTIPHRFTGPLFVLVALSTAAQAQGMPDSLKWAKVDTTFARADFCKTSPGLAACQKIDLSCPSSLVQNFKCTPARVVEVVKPRVGPTGPRPRPHCMENPFAACSVQEGFLAVPRNLGLPSIGKNPSRQGLTPTLGITSGVLESGKYGFLVGNNAINAAFMNADFRIITILYTNTSTTLYVTSQTDEQLGLSLKQLADQIVKTPLKR